MATRFKGETHAFYRPLISVTAAAILLAGTPAIAGAANNSPISALQMTAAAVAYAPTFEVSQISETQMILTVSNGQLVETEQGVEITDNSGVVREIMTSILHDEHNRSAELSYTIINKHQVQISVEDVYTPYGYWECVGKNALGGVVGGAAGGCATGDFFAGVGCLAGAVPGAVGGGVAAGVGSLIWCS